VRMWKVVSHKPAIEDDKEKESKAKFRFVCFKLRCGSGS